jgi:hypothetical protein
VSVAIPSSSGQGTSRPSGRRAARLARRRAAGGAAVLRPKEVCAQLAVSASTLRQWSTEFKDYLSPAAQVARTWRWRGFVGGSGRQSTVRAPTAAAQPSARSESSTTSTSLGSRAAWAKTRA